MAILTLTDQKPPEPEADFGFEIKFVKGEGSPSRVFLATHEFIKFCENLDSDLLKSIDSSIQTVLTLEDIEAGSIKTWLKNRLLSVDDSGIKELDWKKIVGKFLLTAKYLIIRWCEKEEEKKSIQVIQEELDELFKKTGVRYLDDYSKSKPEMIITAVKNLQSMKNQLLKDDEAKIVSSEGEIRFNMNYIIPVEKIEDLIVSRTITQTVNLILPIKKPDYLAQTRWQMRHGKQNISAKIDDTDWLQRFHAREFDLRPGDALECVVEIANSYDLENELVDEKFRILKVKSILKKETASRIPFVEGK
ncbi:MAG: hypothetical protein ORO03_07480 [Alphaproteobacteria bacterium]|nr:hypothetical protein [Alphaproteobacteria bacterium]